MNFFNFKKEEKKEQKNRFQFHFQDQNKIDLPEFKIDRANGYSKFGDDNNYPLFLQNLYNSCPLHSGIVNGKAQLISNSTIIFNNINEINIEIIKQNAYGENLKEILEKIAFDLILFGSFSLKIYWASDFSKIVKIEHVNSGNVRIDEENKIAFIASDWSKKSVNAEKYQLFDVNSHIPNGKIPENYESIKDHPFKKIQILYVKAYTGNNAPYALPTYMGAIKSIQTYSYLIDYYLNSSKNAFTPSIVINFPSQPESDEEGKAIIRKIEKNFENSVNSKKVMVFFSPDKNQQPDVQPIMPANLDSQLIEIQNNIQTAIITGHQITSPELVGINIPGQLGSGNFEEKFKMLNFTSIKSNLNLIERTLNQIYSIEFPKIEIKLNLQNL